MNGHESGYPYDPAWEDERARLSGLTTLFDLVTMRHLHGAGLQPGWRCWEIGAGTGSITRRLAVAVGPTGRVVATDVDLRFLDGLGDLDTVEVLRRDVADGPIELGAFDLVHARSVLEYLPSRDEIVPRLADALRPGGVLVLEDVVFGDGFTDALGVVTLPREDADTLTRAAHAVAGAFRTVGADPEYGLRLPSALATAGLEGVGAELTHRLVRGGTEESRFFALTVRELGPRLVAAGLLTEDDAALAADLAADPGSWWFSVGLVTAWGRRAQGRRGGGSADTASTVSAAVIASGAGPAGPPSLRTFSGRAP
ncbi:MAG: methyltransferase [Kineosporiaceae bacterium]